MTLKDLVLIFTLFYAQLLSSQSLDLDKDALFLKQIHTYTLGKGQCYNWLDHLSTNIGGRLAGSPESEQAAQWTADQLKAFTDTVYLQPCTVPYWVRGEREVVKITKVPGQPDIELASLALGNSIGTGNAGIEAEVIEVKNLDELAGLGKEKIEGKIVFFNRPMDPTLINTFQAYGGAVDQRGSGPARAAEYGAVAVVVRSVTTSQDDIPHTGVTVYQDDIKKIPAVAISTNAADLLSAQISQRITHLYLRTTSEMVDPAKPSFNVVAEIKGSTYPDEIIVVGGHLDSWDVGGGAHDDGAGCVHSMQVLATLVNLGYQPQRTIRCVLFMNEENGLGGGKAYAAVSNDKGEHHIAAIESDAGGFSPRGFTFDATDDEFAGYYRQVVQWAPLLEPYQLFLSKGGSGADISPLKSQKGLLAGLRPDSQRYFDFHHTSADVIEAVNERELKLGAAAMTSLVYLLDKYGLKN